MVIMAPKSVHVAEGLVWGSQKAPFIAPRAAVKVVSPCSNLPESAPAVAGTGWIRKAWTRPARHVPVADGHFTGGGETLASQPGRLWLAPRAPAALGSNQPKG